MAEYDAFGRKIGESPLEQRPAQAEPAAVPVPSTSVPSSSSRKAILIVVGGAVVVAMASIAIAVSMLAVTDEEGAVEPAAGDDAPPTPQEAPAAPEPGAPAPTAAAGSMLEPAVLARAVRGMQVAELGRPISLRVAPDRVDAQLITSNGLLRIVQIEPDGVPRELRAIQAGQVPSMQWSAVDPAAPQRLVRAAAEREKGSAADVDYLVLMGLGEPTWGVFFKDGTHYQGNAAGKLLRRVN